MIIDLTVTAKKIKSELGTNENVIQALEDAAKLLEPAIERRKSETTVFGSIAKDLIKEEDDRVLATMKAQIEKIDQNKETDKPEEKQYQPYEQLTFDFFQEKPEPHNIWTTTDNTNSTGWTITYHPYGAVSSSQLPGIYHDYNHYTI